MYEVLIDTGDGNLRFLYNFSTLIKCAFFIKTYDPEGTARMSVRKVGSSECLLFDEIWNKKKVVKEENIVNWNKDGF